MFALTLNDSRILEYMSNESDSKSAILFHHGTPGHCTTWAKWFGDIKSAQAIAASRPGYGLSDRHQGRSVSSDFQDQSMLLESLGVNAFVSIGWSGGGPHALNMVRHPLCKGAITLAGVGEWGRADLDFLEGMGPENHEEFGAALEGQESIENWMKKNAPLYHSLTGPDVIAAFGGLIGDADKEALTSEVAEDFAAVIRRSISQSFYGWMDDDLAFVRAFGFSLKSINKPVLIWQGDDDYMVPRSHSLWLAEEIPTAELNFVPGHGHISLGENYRSEIIKQALEMLGSRP